MRKPTLLLGLLAALALLVAGCFQVPPAFYFAAVAGAVGGGGGGGGGGSSGVTLSGRVAFPASSSVSMNGRREREPNDRAGRADRIDLPRSDRIDRIEGETQAHLRLIALRSGDGGEPIDLVERDLLAGEDWRAVPVTEASMTGPIGKTPPRGRRTAIAVARAPEALHLITREDGEPSRLRLETFGPTGGLPRADHPLAIDGDVVGLAATSDLVFLLVRPVEEPASRRLVVLDPEEATEIVAVDLGTVDFHSLAGARDLVTGAVRLFTADDRLAIVHELELRGGGEGFTVTGSVERTVTPGRALQAIGTLAYDGVFLHVADARDDSIHTLDPDTGAQIAVLRDAGAPALASIAALYDPGLDGFRVRVSGEAPVEVTLQGAIAGADGMARDIFWLGIDRRESLRGDAPVLLFHERLDAEGRSPWERLAAPRASRSREIDLVVGSLVGRSAYRVAQPGGLADELPAPPPVTDPLALSLAGALRDAVVDRISAERLARLYCDWTLPAHVPGRVVVGTEDDRPLASRPVVEGIDLEVEHAGASPFTRVGYRVTADGSRRPAMRVNGVVVPASRRAERGRETLLVCDALAVTPGVRWCEPDWRVRALATTPNDPLYDLQWNMEMIGMPLAWETTRGSSGLRVAVVDSGVRTEQLDLVPRLVDGYDFITVDDIKGDGDGIDPDPFDESGPGSHGTHVAGIIAAVTDNALGVAGMTWDGSVMPLRALGGADGSGSATDVAEAILYAARLGNASGTVPSKAAAVINLSLGTAETAQSMVDAIRQAVDKGIVVVAATGNENTTVGFPANMDETIAVAAVTKQKQRPSYSNFGPEVDLAAPGGTAGKAGVPSTVGDLDEDGQADFAYLAGTSMACPHVAAAAALLLSLNPDLSPEDIRSVLRETAEDLGAAGVDDQFGAGLLDVSAAVNADISPELSLPVASLDFGINGRNLAVQASNAGVGQLTITGYGKTAVEGGTTSWLTVATLADGKTIALAADRSQLTAGSYRVDVLVKSNGGDETLQVALTKDGSGVPNVGRVIIEVRDSAENLLGSFKASSAESYRYDLEGIAAGKVYLRCGVDENGNGRIGDAGEPFGAYPSAASPALLDLGSLSSLDLDILLEGI